MTSNEEYLTRKEIQGMTPEEVIAWAYRDSGESGQQYHKCGPDCSHAKQYREGNSGESGQREIGESELKNRWTILHAAGGGLELTHTPCTGTYEIAYTEPALTIIQLMVAHKCPPQFVLKANSNYGTYSAVRVPSTGAATDVVSPYPPELVQRCKSASDESHGTGAATAPRIPHTGQQDMDDTVNLAGVVALLDGHRAHLSEMGDCGCEEFVQSALKWIVQRAYSHTTSRTVRMVIRDELVRATLENWREGTTE